jgi:hypothetical protein
MTYEYFYEASMSKYFSILIASVLFVFTLSLVPEYSRAAEVNLGASVWCAWWNPYWMNKSEVPFSPAFKGYPAPAGGPLLSIKIDEQWGIEANYMYGKFENKRSGYIPANVPILMIPLLISISEDRWTERHELDFTISNSINAYVNIFGGIKYSGHFVDDQIKIVIFTMKSGNDNNYAGPELGVRFRIPLVSTLSLVPTVTWVMQFGTYEPNTGLIYNIYNSFSGISKTTIMYYGPDITLSIAYQIKQAHITLALGGRFQYLMIKNIGTGGFPGDGGYDMFGGVNIMAMYSFNVTSGSSEKLEKK